MNQSIRLALLATIFSIACLTNISSQTQINPKAGFDTWSMKDENENSGQSHHSGQMIGFDVHILNNRLLFAPGFHYHRVSVLNEDNGLSFRLPKNNGIHYFTIPLTFGFQVLELPALNAFVMAGGESTFFYGLDKNDIGLDDDMLHGVFASLTGAVQFEVFSLVTLDLKYHYALHPVYKSRSESKLRGWTLAAGVKF